MGWWNISKFLNNSHPCNEIKDQKSKVIAIIFPIYIERVDLFVMKGFQLLAYVSVIDFLVFWWWWQKLCYAYIDFIACIPILKEYEYTCLIIVWWRLQQIAFSIQWMLMYMLFDDNSIHLLDCLSLIIYEHCVCSTLFLVTLYNIVTTRYCLWHLRGDTGMQVYLQIRRQ